MHFISQRPLLAGGVCAPRWGHDRSQKVFAHLAKSCSFELTSELGITGLAPGLGGSGVESSTLALQRQQGPQPAGSLPPLSWPSAPPLFPAERLSGDVTSGLQGHPSTPQPGLGGGLHFRNLRPALPSRCARAPGPPAQAECAARSAALPWGYSFLPRAPKWLCNALIPSLFKIYYFVHRAFFS